MSLAVPDETYQGRNGPEREVRVLNLRINLRRGPTVKFGRLGIFCNVEKFGGTKRWKLARIPGPSLRKSGGYVAFLGPVQVFWFPKARRESKWKLARW